MMRGMAVVGSPRRRLEGRAKVTGAVAFTADLPIGGAAHARLVLSPYPAARITGYDLDGARAIPGVLAVVTGADLPELPGVPGADLPLARGRVFFAGQPVVAVVGETEAAAADGAAQIQVDYEALPAVFDPLEAVAEGAPRVLGESEMGELESHDHSYGDIPGEPGAACVLRRLHDPLGGYFGRPWFGRHHRASRR